MALEAPEEVQRRLLLLLDQLDGDMAQRRIGRLEGRKDLRAGPVVELAKRRGVEVIARAILPEEPS
ncbi:UNVERIFIED_ORG: hypothetical protein GGE64_003124 [Rhizobium etli]|uniref:hypothetical protein n=1 Tax=Rhizobium TaxID=379 RepID=UPI00098EEF63|nr:MULTISPECIES: hypothetical protein [Rhizobium]ARQ59301.1 hypothetical protein Kim5_CH03273 [Rhizobium sp. Kim5]RSB91878.1 hypothetical protein EFR00_25505 [Rhizobium sophoriradicis]